MKLSIGNICTSVLYLSIQPTNHNAPKFKLMFGKTYVGTVFGSMLFVARHSLMFHIRNPFFNYRKG